MQISLAIFLKLGILGLIYDHAGCTKPVERLWISSLTAEAIKEGFKNLKPASAFDNLADAASARSRADWIVGLNFTRAYTTLNKQLCTIGRVQTPTLGLIVERQLAIDKFKAEPFFEIVATFEPGFVARYKAASGESRLQDKGAAQKIIDDVAGVSFGTVEKVETQEKKTKAPALYDLLTLQKDANRRFGYTAQETLNLAQSLYEQYKVLSYPRTESRHLATDMVGELPRVLTSVLQAPSIPSTVRKAFAQQGLVAGKITEVQLTPLLGRAYVDDAKLTDHHAIIPTHNLPPQDLPAKQRNVYELVATRFLSIFLPPEVRDETEAVVKLGEHDFRARGVVIKDPGWTVLEPSDKAKGEQKDGEAQVLPPLTQGQQVNKRQADLNPGKTTPPKPYDDASLLTAMKNAGKDLADDDLAGHMKQSGLGTPATRAQIIERLLESEYIARSKKSILPTEKGKTLIASVHPSLKDVALTAKWEQQLADMVDGNVSLEAFESEIADFLRELLPIVLSQGALLPAQAEPDFGQCPQCGQGVVRPTPKGGGCSRWQEGCKFAVWREQYGKQLTDNQLAELVTHRRTKVIAGFKKKDGSGSTYAARLVLNEELKVKLEFGDKVVGPMPAPAPKSEPAATRSGAEAAKRENSGAASERTTSQPSSQPVAEVASGIVQVTVGLSVDQAAGLLVWQDKGETFTVTITSYEARMLYMAIKKQDSFVAAGTSVRVVGKDDEHCLLHLSSGWNLATFDLDSNAARQLLAALHAVGSWKCK